METRIVGEPHQFYHRGSAPDLRMVGKSSAEWDLNDWKWDGDLFMATPMNSVAADCRSRQLFPVAPSIPEKRGLSNSSASCSDEVNLEADKGKRELEKRRRAIVIEDDDNLNDASGNLELKLGGNGSEREDWEGTVGKKTKLVAPSSSRAVCQVEGCDTDLNSAKDYHRRHKVCETHSKATKAIVGNVLQRFCQQCSRFHALQEFDEGKRSCRRRLAGHNKRRRKTQPETTATGNHGDDQASGYLIISLLKILANMHSNKSDETKDQDLLSHILKSIASNDGTHGGHNLSSLQGLLAAKTTGNSEMVSALLSNGVHPSTVNHLPVPSSQLPESGTSVEEANPQPSVVFPTKSSPPGYSDAGVGTSGRAKMTNIDLNDVYIDSDDDMENLERSTVPVNLGAGSFGCPLWLQQDAQQSSPPQTSRNSDSASAQSPSSSNGDAQSRTDRIVFKLFGKEPNDFPIGLRTQILDWLSHSPTDIESYIRPGCVVLTIYLRLDESEWEELCYDLSSSLSRLFDASDDTFWRTGWVYVRVQHQMAFAYNGEVVHDGSLPPESYNYSQISSVTPIAISITEKAQFSVRGLKVSRPPTRLLCALEGKYLVQDSTHEQNATNSLEEHDEFQCVTFSCSIPIEMGRGFFEVEDDGLSSSFCPFLVAENEICLEIRMLESAIDLPAADEDAIESNRLDARTQAMEFICEMGWLFHRSQLKSRLGDSDPNTDLFPLKRFKWLMEFSMDRDWCAVVKKLLGIMLKGVVSAEEHPSVVIALAEMGLLHRAVRRNSRPLVKLLLRYVPEEFYKQEDEYRSIDDKGRKRFLFTPDATGPAGLTPLHIAAGIDSSENVLDDLLDDPGMVGIEAWKNARDNTGFTPEDYARLRGHYSYIHMVQKKLNRRPGSGQVVVDIPAALTDYNKTNQKPNNKSATGFDIEKYNSKLTQKSCRLCEQKTAYGNLSSRSMVYKPAMLSMVAIAAVCVCVALLFKSSPEVLFVFRPFRWEMLDYGSS